MTSEDLYYDFHLLVNKNNEQKNINVERGNFVKLYNREAERWLADFIERNNNSDNIFLISCLLEKDFELKPVSNTKDQVVYESPENMFNIIYGDFRSYVKSGSCEGIIYNFPVKPQDVNTFLSDQFYKPSLIWERGLAKVTDSEIVVYSDNFQITKSTISYYRIPKKIDLNGYIRLNGQQSTNVDPDTTDYISNQILDRVAIEVKRSWEDQGFQFAQTRERVL